MQQAETKLTLSSTSNPTATVGKLKITLIRQREISEVRGGKTVRFREVRLRLVRDNETRDIYLPGESDETKVMGYMLRLHRASDGQLTPTSPRESIVEILVRPAVAKD